MTTEKGVRMKEEVVMKEEKGG